MYASVFATTICVHMTYKDHVCPHMCPSHVTHVHATMFMTASPRVSPSQPTNCLHTCA